MTRTERLIVWDFDGTLGYRQGMWVASMHQVLRQHDPATKLSEADVRAQMQGCYVFQQPELAHPELDTADAWWEAQSRLMAPALVALGYAEGLALALARRVRDVYVDLDPWHLFDDTLSTLAALEALGWTQVLLSNHVPELGAILRHLGLDAAFAQVYNSAETGYEKPHPRALEMVLEDWQPDVAWMIGDNRHADMLAAQQSGIGGILVRVAPDGWQGAYSEDVAGVTRIVS